MELIILMGLQASGKSTFFRSRFRATHDYISKDAFRNNRMPSRRQMQLVEEALKAGRSVVIDNTNPTAVERVPLIHIGHIYGAEVIGYYFESEVSKSLERNRERTGKAKVPPVAIYTTAKKLTLPSYAEGFDRLYYVRITNNGEFEVQEWTKHEMT